jgi:hypothetical protein
LDLEFTSKTCRVAFPPGEHFKLPNPGKPDVERVNARGDFAIESSRLAFMYVTASTFSDIKSDKADDLGIDSDGDSDPWRPATPQSDYALKRKSSLNKPVIMIKDAVHHFDENGLKDPSEEPKRIRKVHQQEVEFVQSWVREWKEKKQQL